MLDNRLDFITNIEETSINQMTSLRAKFIELDQELQNLGLDPYLDSTSGRTLAISRTNLETSLMYAIKTLCLLGEKVE